MGYYTDYELTCDRPDELESILAASTCEYDEALTEIFETKNRDGSWARGEIKWYGHEKDMKRVSKNNPEILFTLKGEGEEAGDIWVKYFKAGKMQVAEAKITIEDFDTTKLK